MSLELMIRITNLPVQGQKLQVHCIFGGHTVDFRKKMPYGYISKALAATGVLRPECRLYFLCVKLAQL